jgi:hypothetical protein
VLFVVSHLKSVW